MLSSTVTSAQLNVKHYCDNLNFAWRHLVLVSECHCRISNIYPCCIISLTTRSQNTGIRHNRDLLFCEDINKKIEAARSNSLAVRLVVSLAGRESLQKGEHPSLPPTKRIHSNGMVLHVRDDTNLTVLYYAHFHSKLAQTEECVELAESFEVNNIYDHRVRRIAEPDHTQTAFDLSYTIRFKVMGMQQSCAQQR